MFQVLDLWYQSLPRWYTVKDFMMDVDQWYKESYVDRDIWSHLQKYVNKAALPVSVDEVTVTSGKTMVTETLCLLSKEGKYLLEHGW